MSDYAKRDLEDFITAAKKHGEDSHPDHEVGDLQDLLRAAWEIMTPDQRYKLTVSTEAWNVLEGAYGTELEGAPAPR